METHTALWQPAHSPGARGWDLRGRGGRRERPSCPCMAPASSSFVQSCVSEPGWPEQAAREHWTRSPEPGSVPKPQPPLNPLPMEAWSLATEVAAQSGQEGWGGAGPSESSGHSPRKP